MKSNKKDSVTRDKEFRERSLMVFKGDEVIQKARFDLSVGEQRVILFAVSKIRPEDDFLTPYTFDIKQFYSICGIEKNTYTELKKMLLNLRNKGWWMTIDDEGTESAVSWFNTIRTNKGSGKVTVKFHEDMFPFLVRLQERADELGLYYTRYYLKYVLPMKSKYGIRLYELLKSYQKNNGEWFFEISKLRHMLGTASEGKDKYALFKDFRIKVVEPALRDINDYTDLKVREEYIKDGRYFRWVNFIMDNKTPEEQREADIEGFRQLDGQIDYLSELEKAKNVEYKTHAKDD